MANNDIKLTTEQLRRLTEELEPKRLRSATKQSLGAGARKLKQAAAKEVRGSKWHNASRIAKGVRSIVSVKKGSYGISTYPNPRSSGTKGGFHLNRRALWKPVLLWANAGTKNRSTSSRLSRKAHSTGKISGVGFIEKAEASASKASMDMVVRAYETRVAAIAKKLGKL